MHAPFYADSSNYISDVQQLFVGRPQTLTPITLPYGPVAPTPETSAGKWTIVPETGTAAVPEPASLLLFGLGALGLGWSRRRKPGS